MTGWCFFFGVFSDATVFLSVCASPPVTFKIAATCLDAVQCLSVQRSGSLWLGVAHAAAAAAAAAFASHTRRHPAPGGGGGEKTREKELRTVTWQPGQQLLLTSTWSLLQIWFTNSGGSL